MNTGSILFKTTTQPAGQAAAFAVPPCCERIEVVLWVDQGFRGGFFSRYPSFFHILYGIILDSTTNWGI